MKRILSLALVLVLAIGLMAGCGGSDTDSSSGSGTASDSLTNGIFSTADVAYVKDNSSVYVVVRPENNIMNEMAIGTSLVKTIKSIIGVPIKNVSDSVDVVDYEILLGQTNRPESQQALDYLRTQNAGRYKDYIICTIGNKIVINAKSEEALSEAVTYFTDNFVKADGVTGGINYVKKADGNFSDITINGKNIGDFNVIRQRFNSSYLSTVEINKTIDNILNITGYKLYLNYDKYTPEQELEIIVGNTSRPGNTSINDYDTYEIKISGTKVYLNGGSPHATAMAVSEFNKLLTSKHELTDADSVLGGSYELAVKGYDRNTTYYPTYFDTFDGDEIDTTKWRVMGGNEFGREGQNGKWSGMSNDPNFVFCTDGKFYIIGQVTDTQYLGGSISNDHTMEYHYGYVEYSAVCPNGPSYWSLLWCCGSSNCINFSPEIDINECFGNAKVTQAAFHAWPTRNGAAAGKVHYTTNAGQEGSYWCPDGKTWSDDFHTFGLIWDQNHMAVTGDGEIFYSYDTTTNEDDIDAFVNPWMYMKFSYSVGRANNGEKAENLNEEQLTVTNKFIVDWMYLYQLDDGIQGLRLK